jgi:hypothetical protein
VRIPVVVVAVLVVLASAPRVSAFGAVGHHVIARIAWALMTPAAQDRASALLEGRQDAFVSASTWADEIRSARPETYNWHFVDIPVGAATYDAARDCPASEKGDCAIAEILRARADLADVGKPAAARAEALKFVIHFVGDLHQPLHAIDNHDRGGNDVRVVALRGEDGRATNLHAAWDTGILNLSSETEAARADRLLADLRKAPLDTTIDIVRWAEDSHAIAERITYGYPGFKAGAPPVDPITLDEPYRAKAADAIDQQLRLAGQRLASILNVSFAVSR